MPAGVNSGKLKVISMIFGWMWSKLGGCGQISSGDPKICRMSLWIELIFCMLTVMQYFLIRPILYSISLTFKCQFLADLLVRPLAVAERILWEGLSMLASGHLSGCFLEIRSLDFSKFWHVTRNPKEVVHNSLISWKNFAQKIGEMG